MGPDHKYSPVNHGGLEVAERHEAPEVVHQPSLSPPLNRTSSLHQPEPYHAAPYYHDKQEHGNFYGDPQSAAPTYTSTTSQSYFEPDRGKKEAFVSSEEVKNSRSGRRYCGMRKTIFIAVIAIVILLIVVGAVLGVVLGVLLPQSSNSDSSDSSSGDALQAMSMTGLATTLSGDGSGKMLSYYQDPEGRVIENLYSKGTWALEDRSQIDGAFVTSQASPGSPLAAISYPQLGELYRQIFFIDETGAVMTTNRTLNRGWSTPEPIASDSAAPKSIGLAACWSAHSMNGISVFYASQDGYIQQVTRDFDSDRWNMREAFSDSDPDSGVGCNVLIGEEEYLNVYLRNTRTSRVQQVWYDNVDKDGWNYGTGPSSWENLTMAVGSDIAVCTDSEQTEYVHYQLQSGLITRGIVNPILPYYESFTTLQGATPKSKLAASFVEGGALVMFQNSSSESTMWVSDVSRNEISILNGAVP